MRKIIARSKANIHSSNKSMSCSVLFVLNFLLGIVVWVSLATVFSNTMWWPPMLTWGGMANMIGKKLCNYV